MIYAALFKYNNLKLFMKILLLVILVLLVLISGCTQQAGDGDPKQLLKESISKLSKLDYMVQYDFSTEFRPISQPNQFLKTSGTLSQYKKGDKLKIVTRVSQISTSTDAQTPPEKTTDETTIYVLPTGVYQCNKIANSTSCVKEEDVDVERITKLFNTTAALQTIEQSVSSGQVKLKLNQVKTIASRKCYDIEASYQDVVGIKPTDVCLDAETGILLSNSAELKTGGILNVVNMVAKSLSLEVSDSEFVIPETETPLPTNDVLPKDSYKEGEILVTLQNNVTEAEISTLVKSYNLTLKQFNSFSSSVIQVPKGEETKWVDEFKKSNIVKSANLNKLVSPL